MCLVVKDEGPLEDREIWLYWLPEKKNGDGEHLQISVWNLSSSCFPFSSCLAHNIHFEGGVFADCLYLKF